MALEDQLTSNNPRGSRIRGVAAGAAYGFVLGAVSFLPVYLNVGDSRQYYSVYQALATHGIMILLGALSAAYADEIAHALASPLLRLFPWLR